MPTVLSTLLHPQRTPPPPIDVDLARVMVVGTAVWAVALLVTGALWLRDVVPGTWPCMCAAGVVLGVIGYGWSRRNGHLAADGSGAMVRPGQDDLSA
ncbi:DUF2530 domain-containing protein [Cellulomonas phragmiteti]|uniref:DUF2530 domain-containing protein n=1 Tax=Cellulomonas phragmiteti TaxID=478780 RepID=A0ABQ4DHK2_9CELL|nr:DUF2530 domain-containing protein [Cellulomonas phragmiteti]GIG38804.1 hypothetical protein Cph01nite_05660 [Cellulomonas phragmiteti]